MGAHRKPRRRRLRRVAAVTAVIAITGCSAASAADGTQNAPRAQPVTMTADAQPATALKTPQTPDRVLKRVGALFYSDIHGDHFCTASVVDSPAKNLLVTAAHCIHGGEDSDYRSGVVFVPGYHDGQAPFGVWKSKMLLVDDRWAASSDPDHDVGFVALESVDGKNIADVIGANKLSVNQGFNSTVRVTGYPNDSDQPITCVNKVSEVSSTQMRFDCDGYVPGTSGSPWVANFDKSTHTGKIVGVIGGYQGGGDDADISYSAYFNDDVESLYESAVQKS